MNTPNNPMARDMMLRDTIALAALQACGPWFGDNPERIAGRCHAVADAMLAERVKGQVPEPAFGFINGLMGDAPDIGNAFGAFAQETPKRTPFWTAVYDALLLVRRVTRFKRTDVPLGEFIEDPQYEKERQACIEMFNLEKDVFPEIVKAALRLIKSVEAWLYDHGYAWVAIHDFASDPTYEKLRLRCEDEVSKALSKAEKTDAGEPAQITPEHLRRLDAALLDLCSAVPALMHKLSLAPEEASLVQAKLQGVLNPHLLDNDLLPYIRGWTTRLRDVIK
jgi:hypothetical protein